MSSHKPSPSFENAVAYMSSYQGKTSNATKLELYGLFKYVTTSPSPTTSRPSLLDFTGRAKWDAWSAAGKQYQSPVEAESRYIEIAKEFGWDGTITAAVVDQPEPSSKLPVSSSNATEEEDIWDEDTVAKRSGPGGMGIGVSAPSRPEEPREMSLHGVVLTGKVDLLKDVLALDSGIDLDELDEFGYTPLHLASDRGHLEIVKLLLEKGADRNIKDADDLTPRELAEIAGNEAVAALLAAP